MNLPQNAPIAACPLNDKERATLLLRLDDLLRFLGSPGDWGYGTKLGAATQQLYALRREIANG